MVPTQHTTKAFLLVTCTPLQREAALWPGPRVKLFMSAASSGTARCHHSHHRHHCHQLTSLFLARDPYLGCTLAAACCCHSATDPVITLIVSAMSACLRSRHTRQHSCQLQPVNYSISNISAPGPGPGFRGDIWRPADMQAMFGNIQSGQHNTRTRLLLESLINSLLSVGQYIDMAFADKGKP